jgi:hypothetical protein
MTIVFLKLALCLAAVSQGAHAVDNVNEVNVKLPIVSGVQQSAATSIHWLGTDTLQVTTSYTTADETEMLASLDTPINRATRGTYGEDRAVRGTYGEDRGVRMDRADWEGTLKFFPASLYVQAVTGRDDGVVAEARLVAFDQNTRSCKEAVNWTSEGIMLSRVPPSCINVFVVDYTLAEETSSQFLSDMVNQRIVNETLDLGQWAPDSKALRMYMASNMGPTWRVFQQHPTISLLDLEIVESEPPMGMVLTDDLTIRLASPLFYEKGCIATWGFCGTLPTCCEPKVECVRKNLHYAQCRDRSRDIPEGWTGSFSAEPLQRPIV